MKLSLMQTELAPAVSMAALATAARSDLVVLGNVLLLGQQGRLTIQATNSEVGLTLGLPANVEEDGGTTLPGKSLADLLAALPADKVCLELDQAHERTTIQCGRHASELAGLSYEDFPQLPLYDPEHRIASITGDMLAAAYDAVAFSAASDETRPILQGVWVKFCNDPQSKEGMAIFAAVDGFRLGTLSVPLAEPVEQEWIGVIHKAGLALACKIFRPFSSPVEICPVSGSNGDQQIIFRMDDSEVMAQLLSGAYIDWQAGIPAEDKFEHIARMNTAELLRSCRAARVIAKDVKMSLICTIDPGKKGVPLFKMASRDVEKGKINEEVPAEVTGGKIEFGLNVEYVLNAVAALGKTEEIEICLTNANALVMIRAAGDTSRQHMYLLSPMQVSTVKKVQAGKETEED